MIQEVHLIEEKMFYIPALESVDTAQGRIEAIKLDHFPSSTFGKMFSKPAPDEIILEECHARYEPFWFTSVSFKTKFDRDIKYEILTQDIEVSSATLLGERIEPKSLADNKWGFEIEATEHCDRLTSTKLFYDDIDSKKDNKLKVFLEYEKKPIDDFEAFIEKFSNVIQPQRKSSIIADLAFQEVYSPPENAKETHERTVRFESMDLIFRPIYRFKYKYEPLKKRLLEGVSGRSAQWEFDYDPVKKVVIQESRTVPERIIDTVSSDVFFDVTAETMNLFVPGTMIAAKIIKNLRDSDF